MSCCLLYRGNVQSYEIHGAINSLKNSALVPFAKWSPTPFKVRLIAFANRFRVLGVQSTSVISRFIPRIRELHPRVDRVTDFIVV